jgi:hypothetical protein
MQYMKKELTMTNLMLGEALRRIGGPLTDLINKLCGPDWEEWVTALKRFLRKENPWCRPASAFPTWKTIMIGAFADIATLKAELIDAGCVITATARDILDLSGVTFSAVLTDVDLVCATVGELGFIEQAHFGQICARIRELGFELCGSEIGPMLRLQYLDQSFNEWLTVAMNPHTGSDGDPCIFRVGRDVDAPWLDTMYGAPADVFGPNERFVFVRE